MIEMVPSLPQTAIKMPPAAPNPARAGDFVQSLAGFLDSLDPAAPPAAPAPGRKTPAATGKRLPQDKDADAGTIDPALIWMPVVPVAPVSAALPAFGAAADVSPTAPSAVPGGSPETLTLPASVPSPAKAGAQLRAVLDWAPAFAGEAEVRAELPAALAGDIADVAQSPTNNIALAENAAVSTAGTSGKAALAVIAPLRDVAAPQPGGAQPPPIASVGAASPAPAATTAAIQPAGGQAFAAAIAVAALDQLPHAKAEDIRDPAAPLTGLQPDAMPAPVVQPAMESHHAPLDLGQDRGLQQMIDHIETLRDGADARDTRIRLVPDALGSVDVAVRKEGEAVHVHFTAEMPATRAMLSEAQPRLAELAQARGLTLGGATVDSGSGGRAAPQGRPVLSRANASRPIPADLPETADSRVA